MGDFPSGPSFSPLSSGVLSSFGECGIWGVGAPAGRGDAVNGVAMFMPVRVPEIITVYRMVCGSGTGTTGNFDMGIYDAIGTRLVSTGSTAKTTANSERIVDVTDTTLIPGLYYLAFVTDTNAEAYIGAAASATAVINRILGMRHMASAFPLPATATFVDPPAPQWVPYVGCMLRNFA